VPVETAARPLTHATRKARLWSFLACDIMSAYIVICLQNVTLEKAALGTGTATPPSCQLRIMLRCNIFRFPENGNSRAIPWKNNPHSGPVAVAIRLAQVPGALYEDLAHGLRLGLAEVHRGVRRLH
jgi:hypothetical protein